jgi:hypothetical protein
LSIIKRSDDKYHMYYRSVPADKLSIDYQLESSVTVNNTVSNTVTKTVENGQTINWNERKTSFVDIFSEYDSIDRIFDGIEKKLSKMDDGVWEYATFMKYAFDSWVDDVLDQNDYDSARDSLKKILEWKLNSSSLNPDLFGDLRQKMGDENISSYDKVMIVDRFKWIFSYHPTLSDWINDWEFLQDLVYNQNRGNYYMGMFWYDKITKFPLKDDSYRRGIVDSLKNEDKLSKPIEKNLFWMTAFYRHDNTQWKWYSMTQMWSTNVLGGHMEKIVKSDLESTQNWFLNNLDKSGPHKNILKETLQKQIWISGLELNNNQLKQLLSWNHIDINDWKTRIKLDLDYVFYLLWECANESIGVDLKSITVMERIITDDEEVTPNPVEDQEEINEGWRWKVTVKWDKFYSSGVYGGTIWSNAQNEYAKKDQKKVAGGYIISPEKPDIVEPDDDPRSEPGSGDEPDDNPWSWPGDWWDTFDPDPSDNSWSGVWDDWDGLGAWWDHGT